MGEVNISTVNLDRYLCIDPALVESLYRGATENNPFITFLTRLRMKLGGNRACIRLVAHSLNSSRLQVSDPNAGAQNLREQFKKHYKHIEKYFHPVESGRVVTFNDIVPREHFTRTPAYRLVFCPNDIGDVLHFCFGDPKKAQAWILISRGINSQRFDEYDKMYCRALLPLLNSALDLYIEMQSLESQVNIYERMIEQFGVGAIILNEHGDVIKSNAALQNILKETKEIHLKESRLYFSDMEAKKKFQSAFNMAISQRAQQAPIQNIRSFKIAAGGSLCLGVSIKSLPETRWHLGRQSPAVIICILKLNHKNNIRESFVSQLFGLTMSEATLAILLAEGSTIKEAAATLLITEHSARTVCKRIFTKMGVRRQADVARNIINALILLQ